MRAVIHSESPFVPTRLRERPDVREGGEWTRLQALKNWLVRTLVRGAIGLVDRLPEATLLALGAALGRAARLVLARARRAAQTRAARCLPPRVARRTVDESFVRAGVNLARCALLRRPGMRALGSVHVGAEARRILSQSLAENRGVVFVSAHLGPFEKIAAAVAELGHRPAVVVRESYDPGLNAIVDRHRLERGIQVIHRGSSGAGFSIMRALRAGQPVGFLPDLGARVPSIELPFLGEAVAFPIGPQLVAERTGAPVVVGTLAPRSARTDDYELVIERMDSACDVVELTHRVAGALEKAILRAPEDWLWMSPPIRRLPSENAGR